MNINNNFLGNIKKVRFRECEHETSKSSTDSNEKKFGLPIPWPGMSPLQRHTIGPMYIGVEHTELKVGKNEAIEAVKKHGMMLSFITSAFTSDKDVVIEAVKRHGWALEYATSDLKADAEIVLEAVSNDGLSIQYASEELRADKTIVLHAVKNNGWALAFVPYEFQDDKEIAYEAVKSNAWAYGYISERLKDDEDILFELGTTLGFDVAKELKSAKKNIKCDKI